MQVFGQRQEFGFKDRFGFLDSVWHLRNGSVASFCAVVFVVVVVFTTTPAVVAPIELTYHTSLDSLCAGQVKLSSARFNQTVIVLRHKLVN